MWLGYATQIMKVVHVSFYNKKAKNASDFIFSRSSSGQTYACNEPFDRFFFDEEIKEHSMKIIWQQWSSR